MQHLHALTSVVNHPNIRSTFSLSASLWSKKIRRVLFGGVSDCATNLLETISFKYEYALSPLTRSIRVSLDSSDVVHSVSRVQLGDLIVQYQMLQRERNDTRDDANRTTEASPHPYRRFCCASRFSSVFIWTRCREHPSSAPKTQVPMHWEVSDKERMLGMHVGENHCRQGSEVYTACRFRYDFAD